MPRSRFADPLLLFLLTAALIAPLFRIEYFDDWMSIEGSFISNARYILDHWPHPGWDALWYCGTRFDYIYAPGTLYGAAIISKLLGLIPARGYHIYIGLMYCLGTAGVYVLVRVGTASRRAAWIAACAAALLSPTFLFLKPYREDSLQRMPERLNVLIRWGEGPHMSAMAAIPWALAFALLAFRGGERWTIAAAALCSAFTVTNNLYGALALAIFFPVLVWSAWAERPIRTVWLRAAAIVLLAGGLCVWWLTPSFLRITDRNLILVAQPGNAASKGFALALALLFAAGSWWAARRWRASAYSLFVTGSVLFFTLDVVGQFWFHFRVTGEPMRFVPELDLVLILGAVELLRRLWRKQAWAAAALALVGFSFSIHYVRAPWRVFQADPNYRSRVEYRLTEWIAKNLPGTRVFTAGSVSFWYDTWRDLPEVTGASDQGTQSLMPPLARWQIFQGKDLERDILWLQCLGTDALALFEKNSQEIYHDESHPRKFAGLLPLIYDRDGDLIYKVPRHPGLARVVDEAEVSKLPPIPWSDNDREQLRAYAAAVERLPPVRQYERPDVGEIRIAAVTQAGQSVLVQENYDPGWRAWVDGKRAPIERDVMQFMRVRTQPGAHQIVFRYQASAESQAGAWISTATLVIVLYLIGLTVKAR